MTKDSKTTQKFLIIDGHSLIHRSFHAIKDLSTSDGMKVNALYGFAMTLLSTIQKIKPQYIAVTFDLHGPTFRHEKFPEYKGTRPQTDPDLIAQVDPIKNLVQILNIPIFEQTGFEADDLIGSLCYNLNQNHPQVSVIILSSDKDTLQLVNEQTQVLTPRSAFSPEKIYDPQTVQKKYGFPPKAIVDYKALRGDPSDNIPGVKGIGEKTATELLKKFHTLKKIYQEIDDYDGLESVKPRTTNLLKEHRQQAQMSYFLATIKCDLKLEVDLGECRLKNYDQQKAKKFLQRFEFQSLIKKLPPTDASATSSPTPHKNPFEKQLTLIQTPQELENLIKQIKDKRHCIFDLETSSLDPLDCQIIGLAMALDDNQAYYIPLAHQPNSSSYHNLDQETTLSKLAPLWADKKIKKIAHNLKFDAFVLKAQGFDFAGYYFDTMIAAYLVNPSANSYSLKQLALKELNWEMTSIEELIGAKKKEQQSFATTSIDQAFNYAASDALATAKLYNIYTKKLAQIHLQEQKGQSQSIEELFYNIEMPLVAVLIEMEKNGISIDTDFLKNMSRELQESLKTLENDIWNLAGQHFNIRSTKQLQDILFNKLQIKKTKKIKTGYSTNAASLEKIVQEHPIIWLILQHRELTKLQTTYVDALPPLIHPLTNRLHTSFNQTITTTGRLSSSNPNLQNIPIRTKMGRQIRKAFVAPSGRKILAADYSQIEFRILAHLAQDQELIQAYKHGADFHTTTASKIFEIPPEQITKDQRRQAKTINFGVMYGQTAYGLQKQLGVSYEEAQSFIDNFYKSFPQTAAYFEKIKFEAESKGYVHTLFGRIRPIEDLHSSSPMRKAAALRMAINMPVQGTAADIMKIAMIKLLHKFRDHYSSRPERNPLFLLQVHDEIVLEVLEEELDTTAQITQEVMQNAYQLDIPLQADIEVGPNWGQLTSWNPS